MYQAIRHHTSKSYLHMHLRDSINVHVFRRCHFNVHWRRSEVLAVVCIKITVFLYVTPYSLVYSFFRMVGTYLSNGLMSQKTDIIIYLAFLSLYVHLNKYLCSECDMLLG